MVEGEALALELEAGQWRFVLLPGQRELLFYAARDQGGLMDSLERMRAQTAPVPVRRHQHPKIVTFADLSVPESVRRIREEDFDKVFGEGVRLASLTIEATGHAVPRGVVANLLPWLCTRMTTGSGAPPVSILVNGVDEHLQPNPMFQGVQVTISQGLFPQFAQAPLRRRCSFDRQKWADRREVCRSGRFVKGR